MGPEEGLPHGLLLVVGHGVEGGGLSGGQVPVLALMWVLAWGLAWGLMRMLARVLVWVLVLM